MKKTLLASLGLAILLTASACNRMDRLLGKDNSEDKSDVVPVAAPAPAPPTAPPGVERYDLYKDGGGAIHTDPLSEMKAVAPVVLLTQSSGGGEGTEFFRIHTENNGSFSMTFDKDLTGRTVDLSGRSSLAFMVRFHHRAVLPTDEIFLFVEDGTGAKSEVALQSASGVNIASLDVWHTVSIPVSSFGGVDVTKIKRPFGVRIGAKGNGDSVDDDPAVANHLDLDFDDLRWAP